MNIGAGFLALVVPRRTAGKRTRDRCYLKGWVVIPTPQGYFLHPTHRTHSAPLNSADDFRERAKALN